jgi:predicted membrane channel-forming protein YqfA (hemolysin III family)
MRLNNLVSFAGFVILIAATYCPILHPITGNWNVYDCNKPYGLVILLVTVVGIVGTVFDQAKITRMAAWVSLGLVFVFLVLTLLKVYTSFDFIPLHFVARYFTSKIKFNWGWYLLFGGPLLALAGVLMRRKTIFK